MIDSCLNLKFRIMTSKINQRNKEFKMNLINSMFFLGKNIFKPPKHF